MKHFSIGEALRIGWDITRKNIGFFIGLLIIGTILDSLPKANLLYLSPNVLPFLSDFFHLDLSSFDSPLWTNSLRVLQPVLAFFIGVFVSFGYTRVALSFVDHGKANFKDFFSVWPVLLNGAIATVFYFLIVMVGLLLFIIPGVIWALRYYMFPYHILDQNAGPIEALKLSAITTYGAKWDLFGLLLVTIIIFVLGALALLVGLFLAIPTVLVAWAYVYTKLSSRKSYPEMIDNPERTT